MILHSNILIQYYTKFIILEYEEEIKNIDNKRDFNLSRIS